jgi:hypothetical protein
MFSSSSKFAIGSVDRSLDSSNSRPRSRRNVERASSLLALGAGRIGPQLGFTVGTGLSLEGVRGLPSLLSRKL